MLKCLYLNHKQCVKVFQTIRFQKFHTNRNDQSLYAHLTQCIPISKSNSLFVESFRCIQTTSTANNSVVAQERSKYESNTLPKETRVVICGGGVIGGDFQSIYIYFFYSFVYFFRGFFPILFSY